MVLGMTNVQAELPERPIEVVKIFAIYLYFTMELNTGIQRLPSNPNIPQFGNIKVLNAKTQKYAITKSQAKSNLGNHTKRVFSGAIKSDSTRNGTEDTYIRRETSYRPCRVQK